MKRQSLGGICENDAALPLCPAEYVAFSNQLILPPLSTVAMVSSLSIQDMGSIVFNDTNKYLMQQLTVKTLQQKQFKLDVEGSDTVRKGKRRRESPLKLVND